MATNPLAAINQLTPSSLLFINERGDALYCAEAMPIFNAPGLTEDELTPKIGTHLARVARFIDSRFRPNNLVDLEREKLFRVVQDISRFTPETSVGLQTKIIKHLLRDFPPVVHSGRDYSITDEELSLFSSKATINFEYFELFEKYARFVLYTNLLKGNIPHEPSHTFTSLQACKIAASLLELKFGQNLNNVKSLMPDYNLLSDNFKLFSIIDREPSKNFLLSLLPPIGDARWSVISNFETLIISDCYRVIKIIANKANSLIPSVMGWTPLAVTFTKQSDNQDLALTLWQSPDGSQVRSAPSALIAGEEAQKEFRLNLGAHIFTTLKGSRCTDPGAKVVRVLDSYQRVQLNNEMVQLNNEMP